MAITRSGISLITVVEIWSLAEILGAVILSKKNEVIYRAVISSLTFSLPKPKSEQV